MDGFSQLRWFGGVCVGVPSSGVLGTQPRFPSFLPEPHPVCVYPASQALVLIWPLLGPCCAPHSAAICVSGVCSVHPVHIPAQAGMRTRDQPKDAFQGTLERPNTPPTRLPAGASRPALPTGGQRRKRRFALPRLLLLSLLSLSIPALLWAFQTDNPLFLCPGNLSTSWTVLGLQKAFCGSFHLRNLLYTIVGFCYLLTIPSGENQAQRINNSICTAS